MLQDNRTCKPKTPDSPALGEIAIKKLMKDTKKNNNNNNNKKNLQKDIYLRSWP